MKKKKFLVTGGTGFIGSNICKYLLRRNFDVTIYEKYGDRKGGVLNGVIFR